ncbi:MAG: hypothetical protein HFJ59_00360 [Clostridia bacterium]|nr:hypothetical protein [Clostridia bacterium]
MKVKKIKIIFENCEVYTLQPNMFNHLAIEGIKEKLYINSYKNMKEKIEVNKLKEYEELHIEK